MKALARRIYHKLKPPPSLRLNKLDNRASNLQTVDALQQSLEYEQAMKLAVGGDFEAIGTLELKTLQYFGLKEGDYVIDVGCGSGRLAKPLSAYLTGKYLGIDIVPDLITFARRFVARPDWRFEVAEGLSIPEENGAADMVCFFSVFTHLLHEQTFVYLQEAKRVLKPDGKIVFSFLDFTIPDHWQVFEFNIREIEANSSPLNMFISKDAIQVWAKHLELQVQAIHDADKPFLPLSKPITFENGTMCEKLGTVGQSVCVLSR